MAGKINYSKGSQGRIIQMIKDYMTETDKKFIGSIEHGICYMLSMEWLRSVAVNKNAWEWEYGTLLHAEQNDAYYKQIARNYQRYADICAGEFKGLMEETELQYDIEMYRMGTDDVLAVVEEFGCFDNVDAMAECMSQEQKGTMFTIRLHVQDKKNADKSSFHRIAAYMSDSELKFYFYDPNMGVTVVESDNQDEFVLMIKECIRVWWGHYASNYNLEYASVRHVKKTGKISDYDS